MRASEEISSQVSGSGWMISSRGLAQYSLSWGEGGREKACFHYVSRNCTNAFQSVIVKCHGFLIWADVGPANHLQGDAVTPRDHLTFQWGQRDRSCCAARPAPRARPPHTSTASSPLFLPKVGKCKNNITNCPATAATATRTGDAEKPGTESYI